MNICMGDMTAAEAIGVANTSYRSAVSAGDTALTAAAAADKGSNFDWATFLADMIKPSNAASTPTPAPAAPSSVPYLVAAVAALLAIVALK